MRNVNGFTILELMIVVAVIGILAAIALPAYQDYVVRSKMAEPITAISACKTSVVEYSAVKAAYPANVTVAGCSDVATKYLASMTVADGVIVATSNNTGAKPAECVLTLTPVGTPAAITEWVGTVSGCLPKYAPANFRS